MLLSERSMRSFCVDSGINMGIFKEPNFSSRVNLYDKFYGTGVAKKYKEFKEVVGEYGGENFYLEECKNIADCAISAIKNTASYRRFSLEAPKRDACYYEYDSLKTVYNSYADGKSYIEVTIPKVYFEAIRRYDGAIFGGARSWEEFLSAYTSNKYMLDSTYLYKRIIMECRPSVSRRYVYEFMCVLRDNLKELFYSKDATVSIVKDDSEPRLLVNISNIVKEERIKVAKKVSDSLEKVVSCPKVRIFTVHKLKGVDGFCNEILYGKGNLDLKGVDCRLRSIVCRQLIGESVSDYDKYVIDSTGVYCKYVDIPKVEIPKWVGANKK